MLLLLRCMLLLLRFIPYHCILFILSVLSVRLIILSVRLIILPVPVILSVLSVLTVRTVLTVRAVLFVLPGNMYGYINAVFTVCLLHINIHAAEP